MNRTQTRLLISGGILVILGTVAILLPMGCGGSSGSGGSMSTPARTRNASIYIFGLNFGTPVTISSGTHVTWNNQSGVAHSVVWDNRTPSTSPEPGANLSTFNGGATSSIWIAPTVTASTDYNYHCGIHGLMMSGKITVTP
jgi:plastocyanin